MKKGESKRMNIRLLAIILAAAMITGCTMAPKYERPSPTVPEEWPSGEVYDPVKGVPEQANLETDVGVNVQNLRWQDFFVDPNLQQVIGLALTNNLDLKAAVLNVDYYRQLYNLQRNELLPAINGTASATGQRIPADLSSTGTRTTTETYTVGMGVASWEIDFFGRIRSLKDQAMEQYLATEQAQRSAQISLIASVASAYVNYAADHEGLIIAKEILDLYTGTYERIRKNFELGLCTELEFMQSASQVEASKLSVANYQNLVNQDKNALDLLLGAPISEDLLPEKLTDIQSTRDISPGLSSEVLLTRPDVMAAEFQLRAANANIGAARASFFPRITLTAALGTTSADLNNLFDTGSGYWSYAPEVVLPIFDTRTWASHRASKVQKEQMIVAYQKAIQSAFKAVAAVLSVRGTSNKQLEAQEAYVGMVKRTYELSDYLFEQNLSDYQNVLDAQRSYRQGQQDLIALHNQKRTCEIQLYSALGGGWILGKDQYGSPKKKDKGNSVKEEEPVLSEDPTSVEVEITESESKAIASEE